MNRFALLCFALVVGAYARENPFETTTAAMASGKTTQIKETRADFNSSKITLPSSARILKSVSVVFQNLDGSISEEIVSIEQNINWHQPLVLLSKSEEKKTLPFASIDPVVVEPKKVELSKSTPTQKSMLPVKSTNNFKLNDKIAFEINQNEIKILSKDLKMRDFIVSQPYKIVLDFQKETSFTTTTLPFDAPPFVSATLGNHDGFYRIAILLDGQYRYDISKIEEGYRITLK